MAVRDQVRCPQCGVPNDSGALFCSRCGASQNRPGHSGRRSGRVSLAGVTMALACLICLAVTVFVLYMLVTRVIAPTAQADTTTTLYGGTPGTMATLATSTTVPPSTTTTAGGSVSQGSILVRPQTATASSSLTPTNFADFRPTNLLDGDLTTAWVEGVGGTGTGQWVKFAFEEPVPLARIEIANGYQKDDEFFADYVRIKSLRLDYSDGTRQVIQLLDQKTLQVIEPKTSKGQSVTAKWIKFTILSVYPTYKFSQTAMSDIHVFEVVQ